MGFRPLDCYFLKLGVRLSQLYRHYHFRRSRRFDASIQYMLALIAYFGRR